MEFIVLDALVVVCHHKREVLGRVLRDAVVAARAVCIRCEEGTHDAASRCVFVALIDTVHDANLALFSVFYPCARTSRHVHVFIGRFQREFDRVDPDSVVEDRSFSGFNEGLCREDGVLLFYRSRFGAWRKQGDESDTNDRECVFHTYTSIASAKLMYDIQNMIRRLIVYGILFAVILYAGIKFIAPTVFCWQEGGTWDNKTEVCHIGTTVLTGDDLVNPHIQDAKDAVTNRIDPAKLREVIIKIPNATETTATLARTNDALQRFMASFPQEGTDIEGYAEAEGSAAVVDQDSGLALVPFFVNYGGTGSFVYAGLFRVGTSTMEHLDSILIGDRISIDSVSFERSGTVLKAVVLYKDRKATDPMVVAPAVPKKLVATIENGSFGEPAIFDRVIDYPVTYKDVLKIETPAPSATVGSPAVIRGMARGWMFEAVFPIKIVDANGAVLGEGPATAIGDWMTAEYVPFTATIPFKTPTTKTGSIILSKDNPSGLPENDDSYKLPVVFE